MEVSPDAIDFVTQALCIQSKEYTPWMCPVTIEMALGNEEGDQLNFDKRMLREAQE